MGRSADLLPTIVRSSQALATRYTVDAWAHATVDAPPSTGEFFPAGALAFAECVEAGWGDRRLLTDASLAMAWWTLHDGLTMPRRRHTPDTAAGLLAVCRTVAAEGRQGVDVTPLRRAADRALWLSIVCQAGGPLVAQNSFLRRVRNTPPAAPMGGVTASPSATALRLDVLQAHLRACLDAMPPERPQG
jgi:hypothetical protein